MSSMRRSGGVCRRIRRTAIHTLAGRHPAPRQVPIKQHLATLGVHAEEGRPGTSGLNGHQRRPARDPARARRMAASSSTVWACRMVATGRLTPNTSAMRVNSPTARSECPQCRRNCRGSRSGDAERFSQMPISSISKLPRPRNSLSRPARSVSTDSKALRSTLPCGVSGRPPSRTTKAEGSCSPAGSL